MPKPPEGAPAGDRLVTIATYRTPAEAHLVKAELESEGIECFLADEVLAGIYVLAIGIRLQVGADAAERARQLLPEDVAAPEPLPAPQTDCPKCGSQRIGFVPMKLMSMTPEAHWECNDCKAKWVVEPDDEAM